MQPREITVIEPTFSVPQFAYELLLVTRERDGKEYTSQYSAGMLTQVEVQDGATLSFMRNGKHIQQPIKLTPATSEVIDDNDSDNFTITDVQLDADGGLEELTFEVDLVEEGEQTFTDEDADESECEDCPGQDDQSCCRNQQEQDEEAE